MAEKEWIQCGQLKAEMGAKEELKQNQRGFHAK